MDELTPKPDELVKLWDEFRDLTLLILIFVIGMGVVISLNP